MGRYLKQFFAAFAVAMLLVAAINVAVDPNGIFRADSIKGFNDQKTLKGEGGRVLKALLLDRHPFEVLFFGTSQGEVGLDPASPLLRNARTFNASLSYTNMYELAQVMRYAAERQRPRLVIMALDFISFSGSEVISGDFGQSGFSGTGLWSAYVQRLFSAQSLKDSWSVLRKSRSGQLQSFPQYGNVNRSVQGRHDYASEFSNSLSNYLKIIKYSNYPHAIRQNTFPSFIYDRKRIDLLQQEVARFEQNGAQVLLFVAPVHAWYLEGLIECGLLPVYEQWKRDLTASVEQINSTASRPVRLWDFSGYSPVTTEPVPNIAGQGQKMRWHWDTAHFTFEVGNLILARMLGQLDGAHAAIEGFGVELTPHSIEAALASTRQGHLQYRGQSADAEVLDAVLRAFKP